MNDLIDIASLSDAAWQRLFDLARRFERDGIPPAKPGRAVAGLFFNPSLRTRTSLELATAALGSHASIHDVGGGVWKLETRDGVVMDGDRAEHIRDAVGKFLSGVVDAIAVRSFADLDAPFEAHRFDPVLRAIQNAATVPVINLESAIAHPLQGLADVAAAREHLVGPAAEKTVAVTWAYHPRPLPMAVANTAVTSFARAGYRVRLVCPPGYELHDDTLAQARQWSDVAVTNDLDEGLSGAHIVYAKSWGGRHEYGPNADRAARAAVTAWRIDAQRMARGDSAAFMHCLPVRRNVVVTDDVIDGPRSLVARQARWRLFVQAAVLHELL